MRRLKAKGYKWISLEWNDYGNHIHGPEYREACESEGIVFTIWMTRTFTAAQARQACVESQCEGFLAEGEIPGVQPHAQNWPELVLALGDLKIPGTQKPLPKGVITNFAPFDDANGLPDPSKARVLIENKWACVTECYDLTGPPETWIDRRAFRAQQLGWPSSQPALGLYDGRTFASFPGYQNYTNWSVWAAEYVI